METKVEQMSFFPNEKCRVESDYFQGILDELNINDNNPGWPDQFGREVNNKLESIINKPIRTLSLFSGGGGLDIAFHDVGFKVIEMVEIDSRFHQTLLNNSAEEGYLQGTNPLCKDIREYHPDENLEIDFIIGGPPCQTFSAAGRRAAGVQGTDDPRGTLFSEYVRILKKLQPKGFLFENVYGIIGAQGGKAWEEIVLAFQSAGYKISFRILDTADYGVPQHRERLIIVGVKDREFQFPRPTHGPDSGSQRAYYVPKLALENIESEKPDFADGRYGHLLKEVPPGLNYSFFTEKFGHPNPVFAWRSKFSDFLYKADPNRPVRTLKAQGGKYTGPFHWESRPFSIDELKRLQTFPDAYAFSGSKQAAIMQIGNSVPPHFGRMLALAVLDQIFKVELPFKMKYLLSNEELGFRKRKRQLSKQYQAEAIKEISRLKNLPIYKDKSIQLVTEINSVAFFSKENFNFIVDDSSELNLNWNLKAKLMPENNKLVINTESINNKVENGLWGISVISASEWNLPFDEICLRFPANDKYLFTASWKMFEYFLRVNNIKADLVQLNGYYQYKPNLKITPLEFPEGDSSKFWSVLGKILNGEGIREILSLESLGDIWNMSIEEVQGILIELREIGYEVRSQYTNNQIPENNILIPYAFPTLSPNSVQLSKQLFPNFKAARR